MYNNNLGDFQNNSYEMICSFCDCNAIIHSFLLSQMFRTTHLNELALLSDLWPSLAYDFLWPVTFSDWSVCVCQHPWRGWGWRRETRWWVALYFTTLCSICITMPRFSAFKG